MPEAVITIRGLRKAYGELEAVRGIDLTVESGEIFAFLGPNGAGKTTTVEIMEGYRPRSSGEVSVLGIDPARPTREWRERMGLVLQESRLVGELTPREMLTQYAGYYSTPRKVGETIGLVGLEEKADTRTARLSGGQRRRLDVALALVGDPELLFLDEPTTGFDPSARRQAWEVIDGLRLLGKTIFLTTHYMEEAQALADRVAIISRGQIVASGTPEGIGGRRTAMVEISFRLPEGAGAEDLPPGFRGGARVDGAEVRMTAEDPVAPLRELTEWATARGGGLPGLEVRRPSLEDVYLDLVDEEVSE